MEESVKITSRSCVFHKLGLRGRALGKIYFTKKATRSPIYIFPQPVLGTYTVVVEENAPVSDTKLNF